jgi:hypothetical protein
VRDLPHLHGTGFISVSVHLGQVDELSGASIQDRLDDNLQLMFRRDLPDLVAHSTSDLPVRTCFLYFGTHTRCT